MKGKTAGSCLILTSLGAKVQVLYGTSLGYSEPLSKGQTMVLPAALGDYRIEGQGRLAFSYVPTAEDEAWQAWKAKNEYLE
jgi:mannose-6-phosphate isomerase